MAVMLEGNTLSDALTNVSSVISTVTTTITGNSILFTLFAGGLVAMGAKLFRKIKNSVK